VSTPAAVAAAPGSFACPHCRRALAEDAAGATCAACRRRYDRHHGILDLRVFADPFLGIAGDRARADRVVAELDRLAFPELLEAYWSWSESTPVALRRTFVQTALRAASRARDLLDRMEREGVPLAKSRVLEIGSGTGGFLAEAHGRVREVFGLDIALRWLHLGRRRLRDLRLPPAPLVCAGGEHLPFPDGAFDAVVSTATLEFTRDVHRVLAECARVLRPGGRAYLNTVNRFSLAAEPHVRLWGVGWLPRAWQAGYVRRRGRGDFSSLRLLSYRELARGAARDFAAVRIEPAAVPRDLMAEEAPLRRLGARAYAALNRIGPGREILRWVGPEWDLVLTRGV
jgi:SAM-dependent methyltransferase